MTNISELKALAQELRTERQAALRAADTAQDCLNEIQRKIALFNLQSRCDTPLADHYGG